MKTALLSLLFLLTILTGCQNVENKVETSIEQVFAKEKVIFISDDLKMTSKETVTVFDTLIHYYNTFLSKYERVDEQISDMEWNIKDEPLYNRLKKISPKKLSKMDYNFVRYYKPLTKYQKEVELDSLKKWYSDNRQQFDCYFAYTETIKQHADRYKKIITEIKAARLEFEVPINDNLSYFGEITIISENGKIQKSTFDEINKCYQEFLELKNSGCK